jgi:hypothetical protein
MTSTNNNISKFKRVPKSEKTDDNTEQSRLNPKGSTPPEVNYVITAWISEVTNKEKNVNPDFARVQLVHSDGAETKYENIGIVSYSTLERFMKGEVKGVPVKAKIEN